MSYYDIKDDRLFPGEYLPHLFYGETPQHRALKLKEGMDYLEWRLCHDGHEAFEKIDLVKARLEMYQGDPKPYKGFWNSNEQRLILPRLQRSILHQANKFIFAHGPEDSLAGRNNYLDDIRIGG